MPRLVAEGLSNVEFVALKEHGKGTEGTFTSDLTGLKIFYYSWPQSSESNQRGAVYLLHGFGEVSVLIHRQQYFCISH